MSHLARSGVRTICFHEQWTDIQAYPATTHGKELKKLAEACRRENVRLLLYLGYEMSTLAPEWAEYSEKCLVEPRAGGYKRAYQPQPDQTAYIVCYRSAWQDFIAAHLEKLMKEYGIGGVYLDGTSEPWGCTNTAHGCGYKRPDGSIGPTYPIFATRSMMKRIYTIVRKHDPQGQVNVHQSTCMVIPTLAFATSYWDGEQLQGLPRPKDAGHGAAAGCVPLRVHGPQLGRAGRTVALCLAGPSSARRRWGWRCCTTCPSARRRMDDVDELARVWQAFDALGRHEADVAAVLGERPIRLSCGPEGVKASLYNRPGKGFVAVVANTGSEACQAEAAFDLAALRQPTKLAARDVLSGKELPLADGRLALPLEPLGFVILRAEPR